MPSQLQGRLKQTAEKARTEKRLVLVDFLDVGFSISLWCCFVLYMEETAQKMIISGVTSCWPQINWRWLENANITNLGKQKLDYTLRHRYPWEEEPHLVRELGQTREDGPRAESVIAGDVWSIILRP